MGKAAALESPLQPLLIIINSFALQTFWRTYREQQWATAVYAAKAIKTNSEPHLKSLGLSFGFAALFSVEEVAKMLCPLLSRAATEKGGTRSQKKKKEKKKKKKKKKEKKRKEKSEEIKRKG